MADLSGVRYPVMVLPTGIARVARVREAVGIPGPMPAEASDLMGRDWRFTSRKAERELGYSSRSLEETLRETIAWCQELIADGAFGEQEASNLSRMADGVRTASRLGMLTPLRVGERLTGRQMIVGI